MLKSRCFILCVLATVICSCSGYIDNGDDPRRKTNPGYVAFDYTCYPFKKYVPLFRKIYNFNEYYIQPTTSLRDSVGSLYFSGVRIANDSGDIWIIRNVNNWGYSEYPEISVDTNGKSLNEAGAVWRISDEEGLNSDGEPFSFDIEVKDDGNWHISMHDNVCYGFECSTEWNVRFRNDGRSCTFDGSGVLLSLQYPKLQLDYTITEPVEVLEEWGCFYMQSGNLKILAKDVNKNITEETGISILSDRNIEVSYSDSVEEWDYMIFW